MIQASAISFRQNLGEMLNQVQYRHDSVVINTDGKPVAALVDALCQRIEAGYDGVPEDEGIAEIEAASCQPRLTARHGLSSRQIFRCLTRMPEGHLLRHMPYQEITMNSERHVSLFRNGRNQAVRIPREFELEGTEAIIRKEGARLIIEPIGSRHRLLALLAGWAPLQEAFPEIADPPPEPEDVF